jgi:phosphoenolpyruvate carboxykinase (GTP)
MAPTEAHRRIDALFDGVMRGRTALYVVPYCMGPVASRFSRCGVGSPDSPYVVLNMGVMTRMGTAALRRIRARGQLRQGLHLDRRSSTPGARFIMHFPEELSIKSIGSGLRRQRAARQEVSRAAHRELAGAYEGWLAEHMLIVGIENPAARPTTWPARFRRLRQDQPRDADPARTMPGWKVWTVGEDIAWLHPGSDGRLRAINPEAGFFGVVPAPMRRRTERVRDDPPRHDLHQRRGDRRWAAVVGRSDRGHSCLRLAGPALRQGEWSSRASQCALHRIGAPESVVLARTEDPEGVPISAILFGGRRREVDARSSTRPATGVTACSWARAWRRKRRQPQPARSVWSGAIQWR